MTTQAIVRPAMGQAPCGSLNVGFLTGFLQDTRMRESTPLIIVE